MTSKTVAKDIITLRGSAAIVSEFFVLFIIVEFRVLLRSRYMVFLCFLRKTRVSNLSLLTLPLSFSGCFGYNEQKPTAKILERWNFSIKTNAEVVHKGIAATNDSSGACTCKTIRMLEVQGRE
ncbi:hypothetical protein ACFE04_007679 [Oxalis oulophora]